MGVKSCYFEGVELVGLFDCFSTQIGSPRPGKKQLQFAPKPEIRVPEDLTNQNARRTKIVMNRTMAAMSLR
jgi:hypothetical protein